MAAGVDAVLRGASIACLICFVALFLPVSIAELVIAARYGDKAVCIPFTIPIVFKIWLAVKSAAMLLVFFTWGGLLCDGGSTAEKITKALHGLISFFVLIWLVMGSVMFWHDCNSVAGPPQLNRMMWASLILGFITLTINCAMRRFY